MNLRPECVIEKCERLLFTSSEAGGMFIAEFSCEVTGEKRTCLYPENSPFLCPHYVMKGAAVFRQPATLLERISQCF